MNEKEVAEKVRKAIRDIPDFPKKGIIFKDITPLLQNGKLFRELIDLLEERYKGSGVDVIIGMEARGFIFGAALACKLGCSFVPVRKKGKLPYETINVTYELEYGTDTLEMHVDAISKGQKVLILDDLLATGGTASAMVQLVDKLGGELLELAFIIELDFLKGREKLKGQKLYSLVKF